MVKRRRVARAAHNMRHLGFHGEVTPHAGLKPLELVHDVNSPLYSNTTKLKPAIAVGRSCKVVVEFLPLALAATNARLSSLHPLLLLFNA